MKTVTTREAQHHFAKIISHIQDGEEVIVTKRGKKVARILPPKPENGPEAKVNWTASVQEIENANRDRKPFLGSLSDELRNEERY